jgi:phage baseplate assembly protein W
MAIIRTADKYTVNSKLQEKFSDFVSPFEVNPDTGDLYRNINDFAIRESLKNLILTDQGERPFQPTLGGNIRRQLFEIVDEKMVLQLKTDIEITIHNHEPRVILRDLSIVPDEDNNQVTVTIFYTTINSPGLIQELPVTFLTRVR